MEVLPEEAQSAKIYQLLLRCGAQRNQADFCSQLVRELSFLIPYDQARVIFLDKTGKISGSRLFGVNARQWKAFMHYYENDLVISKYSMKAPMRLPENEKVSAQNYWCDSEQLPKERSEFYDSYVRSLRLHHSMGIGLSDQENCIRSILVLDRVKDVPFSFVEIELARKIHPLLENYHIDLLLENKTEVSARLVPRQDYYLTKRETEIVDLLLDGLTPRMISQRISVSVATVYKHIANIYQKSHVSNRQELQRLFSGDRS